MGQSTTRLVWCGHDLYVGSDSGRHSVVVSTQDEAERVGIRPADLLLMAIASCTAVDVVSILAKKRMPLESMEIQADGVQDDNPPYAFRAIHLTYRVEGAALTEAGVRQAIELAEGKYCSVSASLKPQVQVTTAFEILSGA
jgi:putative redox protein